jgi:hypothetical protein
VECAAAVKSAATPNTAKMNNQFPFSSNAQWNVSPIGPVLHKGQS